MKNKYFIGTKPKLALELKKKNIYKDKK